MLRLVLLKSRRLLSTVYGQPVRCQLGLFERSGGSHDIFKLSFSQSVERIPFAQRKTWCCKELPFARPRQPIKFLAYGFQLCAFQSVVGKEGWVQFSTAAGVQ